MQGNSNNSGLFDLLKRMRAAWIRLRTPGAACNADPTRWRPRMRRQETAMATMCTEEGEEEEEEEEEEESTRRT